VLRLEHELQHRLHQLRMQRQVHQQLPLSSVHGALQQQRLLVLLLLLRLLLVLLGLLLFRAPDACCCNRCGSSCGSGWLCERCWVQLRQVAPRDAQQELEEPRWRVHQAGSSQRSASNSLQAPAPRQQVVVSAKTCSRAPRPAHC
jgi:hypothetical protein